MLLSAQPPTKYDLLRGAYGPYRANNDLLSYHLDIRVDPAKKFLSGKNTIRFKMLKDDTRIQLDLHAALKIDKILLGATELKYERDSGAVFVDFPAPLKAGRVYSIDFYYSGNPVETGRFGGITFKKDPAGHTWINTACEGEGASIWWPNKDQWRDEVENDANQRVNPQRSRRRLQWKIPRQDRSRRRLHALGLAGAVSDQQLRRLAEHRQLRPLFRSPRRSPSRLLCPPRRSRKSQKAIRPGQRHARRLPALLRRVSIQEGWLQANRSALLRHGAPERGHLRQPFREWLPGT